MFELQMRLNEMSDEEIEALDVETFVDSLD
jgi:hypothetical protein